MKSLFAVLVLALACRSALAADADRAPAHPFSMQDLVMMDRVGDPQLSSDGRYAAFTVRATDYAADKSTTSIYVTDLGKPSQPVQVIDKGSSPHWSPDSKSLYYVAPKDGTMQVWRRSFDGIDGGKALALTLHAGDAVTAAPIDVDAFKLSPDGSRLLLSYDVFTDCADLACTKHRLDDRDKEKATGTIYDKLFIRYYSTWTDGLQSQLYIADARAPSDPELLSRGISSNGNVSFSPDGSMLYFDGQVTGKSDAWAGISNVYAVPTDGSAPPTDLTENNPASDNTTPLVSPDGKTLFYLAKVPQSEADRVAIVALDIASGARRDVAPSWDRSPSSLKISADGKTLYTATDDNGQHPLFAIDVASGKVTLLITEGSIGSFAVGKTKILLSRNDMKHPDDLYTADTKGNGLRQITHFNAKRIEDAQTGDFEFFNFKGADGDTVQGLVVKPVGYKRGQTYPVAFYVHGGPELAITNSWTTYRNFQTYAGQGFAVVAINYHGSSGYGQAFSKAIQGDWAGKPLDDLKLGWNAALSKYSFLDGNRACALGGSYGGYMVYLMAGVWNQPWKCLISIDGVFDTRAMYYDTDGLGFMEKEFGGLPFEDPEKYESINPINHVKDWRLPMLVVHGGKDFRVPDAQGIGAFTALQRRGIPSELLYFPDESHVVIKPHDNVQWDQAMMSWLKRWTAPGTK